MVTTNARMQQLYATESEWTTSDPILLEGEIAVSSDVGRFKVGDGGSLWSALPYLGVQQPPSDGSFYGFLNGQPVLGVAFADYTGDLNLINSPDVVMYHLVDPITNGWPLYSQGGNFLQHMEHDDGTAIQVGYSNNADATPIIQTRKRTVGGIWSAWINSAAYSPAPSAGDADALNVAGGYHLTLPLADGATNVPAGVGTGSVLTHVQINSTQAIQYVFDTTSNVDGPLIWLRSFDTDTWTPWATIGSTEKPMIWRGDWIAGSYSEGDVVQDGDNIFVATTDTTEKPDNGNNPPDPADWDLITAGGGSTTTVGDAFPTQPLNGDLHYLTVEPVGLYVYVEDVDSAQWVQSNGGSVAPIPVEIVEADVTAGWQVWGDILIQWGSAPSSPNPGSVTFAQPFKSIPGVAFVPGATTDTSATIANTNTTGFNIYTFNQAGNNSGAGVYWIAVGEAPDALKKPKVIEGAGGGSGGGVTVEIVEADTAAGWQVWGDTLIQWGSASGSVPVVTFPKPFKVAPFVAVIPITSFKATIYGAQATDVTATSCTIGVRFSDSGSTGVGAFDGTQQWIAIGEAPDALKKPKTVQTIGGTELQEFHDPTSAASWQIVGNKLECWGEKSSGADGTTVTFPKTFAAKPIVTVSSDREAGPAAIATTNGTTTANTFIRCYRNTDDASVDRKVQWHAIGEWDGVS